MITERDHLSMELAHHERRKPSECTGRIVGCVIMGEDNHILAYGANKLPTGCAHHENRVVAPDKYEWVEHAERTAIYSAARRGVSLAGGTAYSTLFPCTDCARGLIEVGVDRLVSYKPDFSDNRWGGMFQTSLTMFEEANVMVDFLDEDDVS